MFLDALSPAHRALFEAAAQPLDLPKGGYLMRKGDPGGDVYLVRKGSLEVVDRRSTPEVVLASVPSGSLVGEMAFIDASPRSADVRAAETSVIARWSRDDLRTLLDRHPDLASAFFQNVSRLAAARIRHLSEGAAAGSFARDEQLQGKDALRSLVTKVADPLKDQLPALDAQLKRDSENPLAVGRLVGLLERLEADVHQLFTATAAGRAQAFVAEELGRELHPWFSRSVLAGRCLSRPHGASGSAEILAHILVDREGGDGPLGEHIDRWLLDRPTFRAMRSWRIRLVDEVRASVPVHRNRRVLVINAGTGSTVARLAEHLSTQPTIITVVDSSKDALSFLDAGLVRRHSGLALETVQENLVDFAIGRSRHPLVAQDAIVIHGLLEYMPARIAVSLLQECRRLLAPDARVVVATLAPSRDRAMLDRLLGWPTLRRTPAEIEQLFQAAELHVEILEGVESPGLLISAHREEGTMLRAPAGDPTEIVEPKGDPTEIVEPPRNTG